MKPFNLFPYGSNIHFMRIGWISLSVAALLTLFSIGTMVFNSFPGGHFDAGRTFNYALDFTGGTVTELHYNKPANVDMVRGRLEAAGMKGVQVQTIGSRNDLLVRLQTGHGTADDILSAVNDQQNPVKVTKSDFVGPQVGRDLAINGLYAALFVILGLIVYVTIRFEIKFAVAAIIATMHDVVVVCGWFAITGHEFDLNVLAGILAVMGFSINDTIVVFDRVRENFRSVRAEPREVMNLAINQTLSRTVITSFVAFLSMFALYTFGGESLRGLAEAQIIGVVIGTLSSIFIGCPMLLWLKVNKQDLMPKAKDETALARRP
jgi:preprotein translocase subunit SecF